MQDKTMISVSKSIRELSVISHYSHPVTQVIVDFLRHGMFPGIFYDVLSS